MPVTGVPSSTITVKVPAGGVVPDTGVTVTVKVSLAFRAGEVLDAETVVVVPTAVEVLAVQALASASRSTDPRPVTRSYPVVAEYLVSAPLELLQYVVPARHSLLPLVTS